MSDSLWLHELQHTRLPCPSLSPRICLNSGPLSRWYHLTLSSSVAPFSSCPQSFQASVRVFSNELALHIMWSKYWSSASASVLPMNIHGWFPLGLIGLIFLQSKGLSRVFSSTTIQKHQFLGPWTFIRSNSHIHTWLLENHSFDYTDFCQQSDVSAF